MHEELFHLDQVGVRLVKERSLLSDQPITHTRDGATLAMELIKDYDREVIAAVNLDSKARPINVTLVSMGTLNTATMHPREIFKAAILSNANCMIVLHNHPSGVLTPSSDDLALTQRLIAAGKEIGIDVLDHIIINNNDQYYSFRENEMMQAPEQRMVNRVEDLVWPEGEKLTIAEQLKQAQEQLRQQHQETEHRPTRSNDRELI